MALECTQVPLEEVGVHSMTVGSVPSRSVTLVPHSVYYPFHQMGSLGDGLLPGGDGRVTPQRGALKGLSRWGPERGRDHLSLGRPGLGL